jgi:hypothetical protein
MPELDLKPETAEADVCRSCQEPIWRVASSGGRDVSLDLAPDAEGNVEMVRVNGAWFAQELHQVECLFDVGPRLRWRTHARSCSATGQRRLSQGHAR